jgi:DNA-binding HxlR family transcriptional regulator
MTDVPNDARKPHILGTPGCPVYDLISRLGDKWSILVLVALQEATKGSLRFSEISKRIAGISERMLTTTLRRLERDGMVTRHVFPTVPPRVDYALTRRGKEMLVSVNALIGWLHNELPEIEVSRQEYDARISNGPDEKIAAS